MSWKGKPSPFFCVIIILHSSRICLRPVFDRVSSMPFFFQYLLGFSASFFHFVIASDSTSLPLPNSVLCLLLIFVLLHQYGFVCLPFSFVIAPVYASLITSWNTFKLVTLGLQLAASVFLLPVYSPFVFNKRDLFCILPLMSDIWQY